MASTYGARYVRLYDDECSYNQPTYLNAVISAAAQSKLGLYISVWQDYDGTDKWKKQIQSYTAIIQNNLQAAWVVRAVALGSEAITDDLAPVDELVSDMQALKATLAPYNMQISLSDFAGALLNNPSTLDASDVFEFHNEPFYSRNANPSSFRPTQIDLTNLREYSSSKPIVAVQTGWASNSEEHQAGRNSTLSLANEQTFFELMNANCNAWKSAQASCAFDRDGADFKRSLAYFYRRWPYVLVDDRADRRRARFWHRRQQQTAQVGQLHAADVSLVSSTSTLRFIFRPNALMLCIHALCAYTSTSEYTLAAHRRRNIPLGLAVVRYDAKAVLCVCQLLTNALDTYVHRLCTCGT